MKYSPLRHAGSIIFKRRPLQFTVFLTRRCNARCAFCFYLSREGNGHSTDELSVAEIDRVSGSLGSLLWLAFSGGEIFLRDDLGEIVDVFYRNTRPAFILLPT
ncbi:MAG: SPASM domain-containing protein, partial [Thermodesulfovibrionales bacterium]